MLPTGEVKISLDEKAIQEHVQSELSKQIHNQLLLVDINRLSEITCMSARYLEAEILHDPRVRVHEVKKHRKRWWLAQPTFEAIKDIVSEW